MEVLLGYPARNAETMLSWVRKARSDGVELLVFPEMAVPGYLIGDEWERPSFLRECEECGRRIQAAGAGHRRRVRQRRGGLAPPE